VDRRDRRLDSGGELGVRVVGSSGRINSSPSLPWLSRRGWDGACCAIGGVINESAAFNGTVDSLETMLTPPEESTRE